MLSWVSYTKEMCKLFPHHCIQKLGQFLLIFAVRPIHFAWGVFVFAPTAPLFESQGDFCWPLIHFAIGRIFVFTITAPQIIHLLNILFPLVNYTNETVPLLLYSKVKANVYILKISKSLLGFQVKIVRFPTIYRPLHVMLGSHWNKDTTCNLIVLCLCI